MRQRKRNEVGHAWQRRHASLVPQFRLGTRFLEAPLRGSRRSRASRDRVHKQSLGTRSVSVGWAPPTECASRGSEAMTMVRLGFPDLTRYP